MISLRQYYHFALWLPVVVPLILWPVMIPILHSGKAPHDNIWFDLLGFLFFSGVIGGIQYIVFALWSIYLNRKSTTKELFKYSFVAPIFFIPFLLLGFFLYGIFNRESVWPEAFVISFLAIPFGYFYVAIAHGLVFIFKKIGFIRNEKPAT